MRLGVEQILQVNTVRRQPAFLRQELRHAPIRQLKDLGIDKSSVRVPPSEQRMHPCQRCLTQRVGTILRVAQVGKRCQAHQTQLQRLHRIQAFQQSAGALPQSALVGQDIGERGIQVLELGLPLGGGSK